MHELSHDQRDVVERVHSMLVDESGVADGARGAVSAGDGVDQAVRRVAPLANDVEVAELAASVRDRLRGLGPLAPLLNDPSVTDVMINGAGRVWVERSGALEATNVDIDAEALGLIIDRIVAPLGLRLDRAVPFVDARLADGSRVHIAVPPLAIDGPCITIRRFNPEPLGLDRFASAAVADIVARAVAARANVIVSGGTGAGKTSLLNAMAALVPAGERMITMEDAAELQLRRSNVVRLEARPPNAEGVGEVSLRSLVRNALRMRPDRLVVGEVRGAEAFDMVQAMNTGHDGSMSTCHANSAVDALHRIEAMVAMSDSRPAPEVVRSQLRSAVDVVVHVARCGRQRRIEQVLALASNGGVRLVDGARPTDRSADWSFDAN